MSEPTKAVFLSYASQDTEAAKKICDALRAAGVEVWFDQNELVGGDAWDQKIRRQIKECALFVPVISASTNARAEGYFRLEWKLAVDRSHLMADDAPFLFPVVIDDTSDGAARVPDRFRDVQWTRLNVKDTPETLAKRVARLIAGGVAPASSRQGDELAGWKPALPQGRRGPTWVRNVSMIGGLAIGLAYALRPLFEPARPPEPKASPEPASNAGAGTRPPTGEKSAAPLSEARQLAIKAQAMFEQYDSTADDFAAAEGMVKHALGLDPNDGEIWAVASDLNTSFRTRGFDQSPGRNAAARSEAERALKLAPDSIAALFALGRWQRDNDPDPSVAEQTYKQVLARAPDHTGALDGLAAIYSRQDRLDEAVALLERSAAQPGHAALPRYLEFLGFFGRSRFAEADRAIRQSIASEPSANSQAALAMLLLTAKGDADGAARVLASGPASLRNEHRTIWITAQVQLCRRAPEEALKALGRLSDEFIQDSWFVGPKAYWVGRAQALAGRTEAARVAWEAGLAEIRTRLQDKPDDWRLHLMRGEMLAWLGRSDEALHEARTVTEVQRGPEVVWCMSPVRIHAALGRADEALPLLEKLCGQTGKVVGWPLTPALLRLDPLWDKLRDDPRFQKLCAEPLPEEKKMGATTKPQSEGAQLAARAMALYEKVGFTRDDLAPAEDLARRATELEPDSATAWGVRAGVQSAWLFRGWDNSEKRRQDTQSFANHALALDPNEPEALLALGHVLRSQGAGEQAVAHLRRASAAHPDHVRLARALGYTLNQRGRDDEGRAVLLDIARRAPRDPLLRYELALTYGNYGPGGGSPENLSAALAQLDAAIAIQPFASALVLKAALLGGWRGDLPAMRSVLDQLEKLPLAERAEDRSVCVAMWAGLLEHRPDRVEAAAALTARNYFDDAVMPLRPKSWSLALAHRLAGKDNLARADWQAAEAALRRRLQDDPASEIYQVELAITLAWLGQRDEAARGFAPIEAIWKEEPRFGRPVLLARYYAAAGDALKAAPYLTAVMNQGVFSSRKVMLVDPWWDKIRGTPEFEALLGGPAKAN